MFSNFTKASFTSFCPFSGILLEEQQNLSSNFDKTGILNTQKDDKNKILPLLFKDPPILSTMITRNKAKIHLVGVIHYTKKSQEDVSNVIRQTQPNVVFVEVCEDQKDLLTDEVSPEFEMATAFQEAQKIPGCQLHFGDLDAEIIIKRCLATVPLSDVISYFTPGHDFTFQKFIFSPALIKVIVEERDTYMAHELKKITENLIEGAVGSLNPPVVVAVVGLAHVAGILEKIDKVNDQDVAEFIQVPFSDFKKLLFFFFLYSCLLPNCPFSDSK